MAENENVEEPNDKKPEPEQMPNYQGDISFLSGVAIQLHEVFLELKKAGFTHEDARHLTGMVLGGFVAPPYQDDMLEDELDEFRNPDATMEPLDEEDLDDDI